MPFCPNSSELSKNNARNITYMAVLIFRKFFDFEQVAQTPKCLFSDSLLDIDGLYGNLMTYLHTGWICSYCSEISPSWEPDVLI